jgi:hypothetical protein
MSDPILFPMLLLILVMIIISMNLGNDNHP